MPNCFKLQSYGNGSTSCVLTWPASNFHSSQSTTILYLLCMNCFHVLLNNMFNILPTFAVKVLNLKNYPNAYKSSNDSSYYFQQERIEESVHIRRRHVKLMILTLLQITRSVWFIAATTMRGVATPQRTSEPRAGSQTAASFRRPLHNEVILRTRQWCHSKIAPLTTVVVLGNWKPTDIMLVWDYCSYYKGMECNQVI